MADDRPVGGVDYPRTFQEFREWFPDDAACLGYLEGLRWPEGFRCPRCDEPRAWRIKSGAFMCAGCGLKTSVTAGTIFHRSHTPISTWFAAAWFITSQKTGISALALQRQFGFGSYETAWAWTQKLRRAMVRPDRELLSGIVELDETFVGGRSTGRMGASTGKVRSWSPSNGSGPTSWAGSDSASTTRRGPWNWSRSRNARSRRDR